MGRIVDAQIHLVSSGASSWKAYPHMRPGGHRFPDAEDAIQEMDAVGVDSVVLVPPLPAGELPDNSGSIAACEKYPGRFGVMGRVRTDVEVSLDELAEVVSQPGMLGIRVSFRAGMGNQGKLRDGSVDWLWRAASSLDIPVMLNVGGDIEAIDHIARKYVDLRLIVDHCGLASERKSQNVTAAFDGLLRLAGHAHVAVKASALPCFVDEGYPFDFWKPCVERLITGFGAERIFWGSDLSRLPCSYGEWLRFFQEELAITEVERASVLGEALLEWLRWDPVGK